MRVFNYLLFLFLALAPISASANFTYSIPLVYSHDILYERFIVASTIYMEARGEGTDGMRAVAAVIKQRAINNNRSYSAVCLKSYQFSCWNAYIGTTPSFYHAWAPLVSENVIEQRAAQKALEIAFSLDSLDTSYYGFVDHYHAIRIKPYWAKTLKPDFVLKNHAFYRLNTTDQDH